MGSVALVGKDLKGSEGALYLALAGMLSWVLEDEDESHGGPATSILLASLEGGADMLLAAYESARDRLAEKKSS